MHTETLEAQKPRVIWIEPRFVAMQKSIDTTFPENVNIPVDWSTDGSTLIFFSYSDTDPGTYYLLQTKTGELVPLMQLNERLQGRTLGQTTPIEITADYAYFRLRDEGYQPDDIAQWAAKIGEKTASCKEVFVYFKHEEEGKGPEFAKLLMQHLQLA